MSAADQTGMAAVESDSDVEYDAQDAFGLASIARESGKKAKANADKVEAASERQSAPSVSLDTRNELVTRPSDSVIFYNSTYQDMTRPVQGPDNIFSGKRLGQRQNAVNGHVEQQTFSEQAFREQQKSFHVLGYAANPSIIGGQALVGDVSAVQANGGVFIGDRKMSRSEQRAAKRKRLGKGAVGEFQDEDEQESEGEEAGDGQVDEEGNAKKRKKEKVQKEYLGPWAGWTDEKQDIVPPADEEWEAQAIDRAAPEKRKKPVVDAGKRIEFGQEKSVFHGKELHDYLGRTYMHVPTDVDVNLRPSEPGLQECFVPKRTIHTWSGHTKGVSKIELFPGTGHLILSGSMDTRIKLWDVYREGKCLRTYMGHDKAVHDVTFSPDGTRFLSAAFDRQVKLWDTETGQCIKAFNRGQIPYCVRFHPDKPDIFLTGMSDKKVIQYDITSGEITQEYDQHLGAVNTITFVDENRRFVSTSDDKTIRVWDFDIPVTIKYIADPSMHSMPAVTVHPNNKWLAMQSLDNQILIFGADSFKQNRKKRFAGHSTAGYACEPHFSPDGRFLSSGDASGNLVIWDWKTSRISSRIRVHQKPIISHAWLPHETSKIVTSSWDGTIRLLD